jgi:hypothetical protein
MSGYQHSAERQYMVIKAGRKDSHASNTDASDGGGRKDTHSKSVLKKDPLMNKSSKSQ